MPCPIVSRGRTGFTGHTSAAGALALMHTRPRVSKILITSTLVGLGCVELGVTLIDSMRRWDTALGLVERSTGLLLFIAPGADTRAGARDRRVKEIEENIFIKKWE